MKRKPKFRKKVWFVVWPKGAKKEYGCADFYPVGVEPREEYTYYDRKGKRNIYGYPMVSFETRTEAIAFNLSTYDGEFVVRSGTVEIF